VTIPARFSSTERNVWFGKFLPLLVLLQICTLLGSLLIASYSDARPTEHISFSVEDGWCDAESEGIGEHCFSDYYFPKRLMNEESILVNSVNWPHPYLPSTTLFHRFFEIFPDGRSGLLAFLGVVGLATLIPALVVSTFTRNGAEKVLSILGLGVLSLPTLVAFDRGNSVVVGSGLACLALLFAVRRKPSRFEWFVLLASLIRPQYLLLIVLAPRKMLLRSLSRVVICFLTIQSLLFWISPGYSFGDWRILPKVLSDYARTSSVDKPYVVNLFYGRSVHLFAERLDVGQGIARFFAYSSIPTLMIALAGLLACAFAIMLREQHFDLSAILLLTFLMVGPSVSYHYYLVNSVLVAMVLMAGHAEAVMTSGLLKWFVLGALFLSLVPFGWLYDESGMSVTVQLAGPSWLLVFVLALWRGGALGLRQLSAERRGE